MSCSLKPERVRTSFFFFLVLQDKFGNYKNKKFCFHQLSASVCLVTKHSATLREEPGKESNSNKASGVSVLNAHLIQIKRKQSRFKLKIKTGASG